MVPELSYGNKKATVYIVSMASVLLDTRLQMRCKNPCLKLSHRRLPRSPGYPLTREVQDPVNVADHHQRLLHVCT